ncbi:hypothetical protein FN846DRAFT_975351 [Sphaerosporella brunnea]|uniref:Gamma interferon inducible lysosomal thiol reductase-domain-containing protein n=1 Tax=Sphaerosporella brunnea TaxID=1250544 RepID=A0A5J5EGM3_9PEZI|nr:hypothetical protein FN846DRAFT_975351 [Sphaerosporella brunnea]
MKPHHVLLSLLPLTLAAPKVPLEIHIMSQCPDAVDCVHDLLSPALPSISNITSFTLSFIGTATSVGVACKHGPTECLGNMLHLCGAALSSPPSPPPVERYWGFTECLLQDYGRRVGQKAFVKNCAERHGSGWGFDEVNRCVSSEDEDGGFELLRKSVERSRSAGVSTSCTVRLQEEVVCVRDGGVWRECAMGHRPEDLVRAVRERWEKMVDEEERLELREQAPGLRQEGREVLLEL